MSREIPYEPMHKPAKDVSVERMCQILEKYTGKPVPVPRQPAKKGLKPAALPSEEMKYLEREQWLMGRLGQHGKHVDAGVTDRDIRRERMREAISQVGPMVVIGRDRQGDSLTYAQAFQKLYGLPFGDSKAA